MLRLLGDCENSLIRKIRRIGQARNRRRRRAAAGCDDDTLGPNFGGRRHNCALILKTSVFTNNGTAKAFKTFLAINGGNMINNALDVCFDCIEVNFGLHRRNAKGRTTAKRMRVLTRRDECFGRHTSRIKAIPAHFFSFEKHNGAAQLSGACRNG